MIVLGMWELCPCGCRHDWGSPVTQVKPVRGGYFERLWWGPSAIRGLLSDSLDFNQPTTRALQGEVSALQQGFDWRVKEAGAQKGRRIPGSVFQGCPVHQGQRHRFEREGGRQDVCVYEDTPTATRPLVNLGWAKAKAELIPNRCKLAVSR